MPMSNYPNGFDTGVNIRGLPLLQAYGGDVYWVDSGAGSDGNKGTFNRPFATLDYAVGRCTADNGDVIMVKPGHSETITAAAGIALDVAGITILGLGTGSNRPTINFTTDTAADLDVDAANITIENVYLDLTGVDGVIAAIDVNAADFMLRGCELLMADGTGQAVVAIMGSTAAHRMKIHGNIIRAPNAGADCAVRITGTADGTEVIGNHIYGDFADAAIHNPTGNVATNVRIERNFLQNTQTGDHAIELVSAVTGIISENILVTDAIATAVDQGSCFAANNMFYDSSDTDATATPYPVTPTTSGQIPLGTADATTTDSISGKLGTDTEFADRSIFDLLGGTGFAAYPTAAAYANDVSIAEVIAYIQDAVRRGTGTILPANTSLFDLTERGVTTGTAVIANGTATIFTIAGGPIVLTHIVGVCVTANDATATTLKFTADPTDGAATDISAASASLANAAAGTLVNITGTLANATVVAANGTAIEQAGGVIIPAGVLQTITAVGATTGTWYFAMRYKPLRPGVTVTAAY